MSRHVTSPQVISCHVIHIMPRHSNAMSCHVISYHVNTPCLVVMLRVVKALANEDNLLRAHCCRHKCFPVCPRAQHLLRTQILCSGHKKCFWFCSETFCARIKCFPVCATWKHNIHFVSRAFARPRNIMSSNVFATMCSQQCVLVSK